MNDADLSSIAELGEFFVLPTADDGPWLPINTLLTDTAIVHEYALHARSAMASALRLDEADVPLKAAASSVHLSIASRLLSPVIGAAITLSKIPVLDADSLVWQRDSSHRPLLAVTRLQWIAATGSAQTAATIAGTVVGEVLGPLNETMRRAVALSPQVLWGNVASAANGAVTVLAQSRPADEHRGRALIAALMVTDVLRDAAEIADGRFRRRNCCLFYQVPGGGYCGDCVLV
ncbi:(2Fe-2S)-binding protein [Mycolicibacterium sp. XJ870]